MTDQARYDELLRKAHAAGLTDREIMVRLFDQGVSVTFDQVRKGRLRLGLPANKAMTRQNHQDRLQTRLPPDKTNPVEMAKNWFGGRLEERPTGYWLDGQPANLLRLMRMMNRERRGAGLPCIALNPQWDWPQSGI